MSIFEVSDGVYYVGAMHWDRRIFDELIPLPDGTTYNSYLIQGRENNVLIDTVDPEKTDVLLENLKRLGVNNLDYVVANHAEQDHSGSIPAVLQRYPGCRVVTNARCKSFLKDLLHIHEDRFKVIKDNDTLPLGGKTLRFILTPWVHWPETMVTYLEENRILFSCDFFGSHISLNIPWVEEDPEVIEDAKRYYAEIMMPFRTHIRKNIDKIEGLKIDMIAPSHGPFYKKPEVIIDAYSDWVSDNVKNQVVIPYVSMHHSTKKMVEFLVDALSSRGIEAIPFNLTVTDIGKLTTALVDAATLIIGTPQVLGGAHPLAVYAAFLVNALRPKLKFVGLIGSFGWGGRMVEQIKGLLGNLKVEFLQPVTVKGFPGDSDFVQIENLAITIEEKHRELGIV